jgi:diphthine-ammonia ligase
MERRAAAVLYSGGKDSSYTIDLLKRKGYEISCVISIFSDSKESYMLHTANIDLTRLSSQALSVPLVEGRTEGKKEIELQDISDTVESAKKMFSFNYLACGGIASRYQKARIERIAQELDLVSLCPLWGVDQQKYLLELVSAGYEFVLTSVSAEGMGKDWLGKLIDYDSAVELINRSKKCGFNAALEGGEGETLVLDCPLFQTHKLRILESSVAWNGYYGTLEVSRAELVRKQLPHV